MRQHSWAFVWSLPVFMLVFGLVVRWMINASKKTQAIRLKIRDLSDLEVLLVMAAIPTAVLSVLVVIFLFRLALFGV